MLWIDRNTYWKQTIIKLNNEVNIILDVFHATTGWYFGIDFEHDGKELDLSIQPDDEMYFKTPEEARNSGIEYIENLFKGVLNAISSQ